MNNWENWKSKYIKIYVTSGLAIKIVLYIYVLNYGIYVIF